MIDIQKFKAAIKSQGQIIKPRFKVDKCDAAELEQLLKISYADVVERRQMQYVETEQISLFIRKIAKWLVSDKSNFGLLLYGGCGNGKTTLAKAICNTIDVLYYSTNIEERIRVTRVSSLDLAGIAMNNTEKFKNLKQCPLIFIDDMGVEPYAVKNYGNEITPLVDLIYARYDRCLFTIVTSNFDDDKFREIYGIRIADRMREMFGKLAFTDKSFR